ncbi:bacteriophage Lambda NinG-like protein [Bacteriovorax sp. BSW11_IV]|uniref:HNH endonuclease n=1 Tax=Bacteriovorax sp. BSW11_IV TaxID=1353529 RepID=UPI000389FF12|nr:HNH endonuclease signature motif containing protein [Bacteriovorax sp. BSW11_IV]EQC49005.1 bacteriophage Lambda NinG-like protein [Bacteriovorax sp. BSW11_IV]
MNQQGIILSVTCYLGILSTVLYLLLFVVLPVKIPATSYYADTIKSFGAEGNISYGDSSNWKYLRAKVLELQGDRCLCCGKREDEMHIDHIKPKSRYPHLQYMIDNLQVLCPDCNRAKSYTRETDYRKSDHLIALVREVNNNKLLRRKYVYNYNVLQRLANKRFKAEMRNNFYPQVLPIS